jgi:DNA (cytosine-5)-methyltransferase 1
MKYLSVCSGIEAATVAWHDLGWTPVAFSEIEPFPSAVLKHHYPHVPNVGDMTKFKEWNLEPIDLLVGGTPCQSFSVAGLRKGLDDPRGNLMLTFLAIAERERPKWIVWENVPGVLSSNGGRDFGTFLAALGELGYGWAYRVLDAQWFGVAQRRRRVFVVGCLGDQAGAAAVLFESESVQRNPAPSREKGQGAARGVGGGPADGSISGAVTRKWAKGSGGPTGDECYNMVAQPVACATGDRTHALTTRSAAEEDGTGRGTPIVPVAQSALSNDPVHAICANEQRTYTNEGNVFQLRNVVAQPAAIAFKVRGGVEREDGSRGSTNIGKQAGKGYLGRDELAFTVASSPDQWVAQPAMQVRRLTPVECERLQGFPDGYTNIPWRKKPEAPDGPRYKALGNSMAVPCMKWIGERIQAAVERQEVPR